MASCRGFECSFWGREGRRTEEGETYSLPSPGAEVPGEGGGVASRGRARGRAAALPGGPFPVWWQRHNIVWPMHRSPAGAVCPFAASDGFVCASARVCVLLCFSTLGFLVIIPSKVTEISFVRQADRALSYYGIT